MRWAGIQQWTGPMHSFEGVCLPLSIPMPIATRTWQFFMGYINRNARRDINMCGSGVTHLLMYIFLKVDSPNHTQLTSRCKWPACFATDSSGSCIDYEDNSKVHLPFLATWKWRMTRLERSTPWFSHYPKGPLPCFVSGFNKI